MGFLIPTWAPLSGSLEIREPNLQEVGWHSRGVSQSRSAATRTLPVVLAFTTARDIKERQTSCSPKFPELCGQGIER